MLAALNIPFTQCTEQNNGNIEYCRLYFWHALKVKTCEACFLLFLNLKGSGSWEKGGWPRLISLLSKCFCVAALALFCDYIKPPSCFQNKSFSGLKSQKPRELYRETLSSHFQPSSFALLFWATNSDEKPLSESGTGCYAQICEKNPLVSEYIYLLQCVCYYS